jgi:hypothetical protein
MTALTKIRRRLVRDHRSHTPATRRDRGRRPGRVCRAETLHVDAACLPPTMVALCRGGACRGTAAGTLPDPFCVDHGQPARDAVSRAADALAAQLDTPLRAIRIQGVRVPAQGESLASQRAFWSPPLQARSRTPRRSRSASTPEPAPSLSSDLRRIRWPSGRIDCQRSGHRTSIIWQRFASTSGGLNSGSRGLGRRTTVGLEAPRGRAGRGVQ